ncbi:MAG: phosphodiester glycosidase family protein [Treponema sp.]|nr:phosphodiester glycosidase family protein [Treponema sp.]MCL2251107.1 phosphodiester glycosidase family protein [Treponema sp.]
MLKKYIHLKKINILFFILLPLFLSCASITSKNLKEFSPSAVKETSNIFSDIESVQPKWITIAKGVNYYQGKTISPKLEFFALQIDLSSPEIRIVVKDGMREDGSTLSTRVSSFTRDNNLIAGINAAPFDVSSPTEGLPIKNIGIIISDGVLLSPIVPRYDALVFYKDGTTAIINQSAIISFENIQNAVGGFYKILTDGITTERTQIKTEHDASDESEELTEAARHPRSAAGISSNGKFLYLLVIDGRQLRSIGATEEETALLLLSLGSWEGINFDGGGSSALALRFPNGNVKTVNVPIHKYFPGQERAVAGCLGIASNIE